AALQQAFEIGRFALAFRGQRKVRAGGVGARAAPFSFAVAHQPHAAARVHLPTLSWAGVWRRPKAGFREHRPLQTRYTFDDRRHMSLHDFISKQYIDVIQWTEEEGGVLATRYPMQDMEIQTG